jgi:hypothetical protein
MRDFLGRYFFSSLPSRPLRIMRVVCGAAMFVHYVRVAPVFLDLFSPKNMGSSPLFRIPSADFYYHALLALILVSASAVMLGWRTRWSLAALFLGQTATTYLDPAAFWGWGFIIRHFLFFLWLSEPWSKEEFAPSWTWRIFQIQISFIYFVAQLNRWGNPDWLGGEAIFRTLLDGDYSRWMNVDWAIYREALRPLGHFGFVLEWAGASLLFLGPLQSPVALILMSMHAGLELAAIVQVWQPLMITALLFFMPPGWFTKAKPSIQFRRRPAAAYLIVGFFALSLIHAWPKRLLSEPLLRAQKWLGAPITYSTLYETDNMNMFAYFGSPGRKCFFVVAEDDDGRLRTMMRDLPKDCRELRPRWENGDEVVLTILRMQRYRSLRRRERVGRYLCGRAAEAKAVYAGRVLEWPDRVEPVLGFDCRTLEINEDRPVNLENYMSEEKFWLPSGFPAPL